MCDICTLRPYPCSSVTLDRCRGNFHETWKAGIAFEPAGALSRLLTFARHRGSFTPEQVEAFTEALYAATYAYSCIKAHVSDGGRLAQTIAQLTPLSRTWEWDRPRAALDLLNNMLPLATPVPAVIWY